MWTGTEILIKLTLKLFNDVFEPHRLCGTVLGDTINDELQGIWREAVVAYFKALSQCLLGGTEENNEISQSGQSAIQVENRI